MIYFILFLYEAIVCYFYDSKQLNEKRMIESHEYKLRISIQKAMFFLLIIVPLWFVMGLRYNIGADYKAYENIFRLTTLYNRNSYHMEWGYYCLNRIAGSISQNPQIIFFLVAFLIIVLFFKGIEKNKGSMYYGVLAFIGMGYYFYAMNIQRQYIAIMIMFYAIYFLEKRKILEYLFCVAFAICFHRAAIIWLPVYFAINYIPTKIFYVGSLIIALLVNRFGNYVLNVLSNVGFYTGQIMKNRNFFRSRMSLSNVIMLGGFLICGVICYKQLQKTNNKVLRLKSIWLAYLIYSYLYIYGNAAVRIATYMCPMYFLFVTDIVNCFDTHTRKWIRGMITAALMVLMFIVITYTGNEGNSYLPYRYRLLWD